MSAPARMPAERIERHLPDMTLLIGQTDLPGERLNRAAHPRAITVARGKPIAAQ